MPWRSLIPQLVATGSYKTQGELVRALADQGHEVTQATVSRELAQLGVRKVEGVYRLPPSPTLGVPVHVFVPTAQDCLVVVKTEPAFAMVLAQAVDDAGLSGVIGTVAGDDTVFVATTGAVGVESLAGYLGVRRPAPALPEPA
jgi:transcriptional regulator of arginine metabolism